jgi:hypothetical protein
MEEELEVLAKLKLLLRIGAADSRRNGQPPKSQLARNVNLSLLVILCSGKLTLRRLTIYPSIVAAIQ